MRTTSSHRNPGKWSTPPLTSSESLDIESILRAREAQRRGVTPSEGPIGIVLLDDMHLLRQALKVLLTQDPRVVCLGDTADVNEGVALVEQWAARVVILNADMRNGTGLAALRAFAQMSPSPRVLALGDGEDAGRLLAMYRAGASGYLPKHATVPELREAIDVVAAGGIYVGASTAKAIATGLRDLATDRTRSGARALISQLSDREKTVLRLVARGFSGPEIAEQLGITTKTVDTYRHRIHEKIDLRHRSDYVQVAMDAGMLVE